MNPALRTLTFQACCAAIWSDGRMSPAEHRHLGHLVESLAEQESEREELRRIAMQGWAVDLLFAQIRGLPPPHRMFVFEKCIEVLGNDESLGWRDRRFLRHLAQACGMGYWTYRRKLRELAGHRGIRAFGWKLPMVLGASLLFGGWLLSKVKPPDALVHPRSVQTGQEIQVESWMPGPKGPEPRLDPEELYRQTQNAFVTVAVFLDGKPLSTGSGSIIGKDARGGAYILTNKHVVFHEFAKGSEMRVEVQLTTDAKYDARLDFISPNADLALLYVKDLGSGVRPLALCRKSQLAVGQPVYVLGSPHHLKHTFTTGVISALRDDYLQTDATISSGSSGGPILESHGAVCGVTTRSFKEKNFSFAIYADAIFDCLEDRRKEAAEAARKPGA
ncbi:MAG: trypsin-like peptidase domain-containing protein [Holophagaceae bacterium]|nr:trypsin-like peptidase domain-containing protein [Holophagaceae bacterium]